MVAPPSRAAAVGLAIALLLGPLALVAIPAADPPPAIANAFAVQPPPVVEAPAPPARAAADPVIVIRVPPPVARKVDRETRRRPPPRAREERAADAILRIDADRRAFVDVGHHHVETPAEIEIPAGRYKVRLHDPGTGARVTRWVTLRAGAVETLRVLLR